MEEVIFPKEIGIFHDTGAVGLKIPELAGYLCSRIRGLVVRDGGDFFSYWLERLMSGAGDSNLERMAGALAEARVAGPFNGDITGKAAPPVVAYEKKMFEREPPRPVGIMYDGFRLVQVYEDMLNDLELYRDMPTVIFTNQLFATYEEESGRYHVRVIILGHPCLISTSGLVEGPAKPKEYYIQKGLGADPLRLKQEFRGRFIDYDDPRMTEVMKGYVMQAVFYYASGEPFCADRECRLYNAHWQEEVIHAQLGKGMDFCDYHQDIIDRCGRS